MEYSFVADIYSESLLNKIIKFNKEARSHKFYPVDVDKIRQAIEYAKYYHRNQKRKSGEPYYSHPVEVANITADYIFSTDILVTSILYDTIEDTELTKEMISDNFGKIIADWLDDLARIKIDKKISAAETLNLLFSQSKKEVLHIKLFDRLHNMRTIDAMPPEKTKKIIDETIHYFVPLAVYLRLNDIKEELLEICSKTLVPDKLYLQKAKGIFNNNSRRLSPAFQNDITQIRNQK